MMLLSSAFSSFSARSLSLCVPYFILPSAHPLRTYLFIHTQRPNVSIIHDRVCCVSGLANMYYIKHIFYHFYNITVKKYGKQSHEPKVHHHHHIEKACVCGGGLALTLILISRICTFTERHFADYLGCVGRRTCERKTARKDELQLFSSPKSHSVVFFSFFLFVHSQPLEKLASNSLTLTRVVEAAVERNEIFTVKFSCHYFAMKTQIQLFYRNEISERHILSRVMRTFSWLQCMLWSSQMSILSAQTNQEISKSFVLIADRVISPYHLNVYRCRDTSECNFVMVKERSTLGSWACDFRQYDMERFRQIMTSVTFSNVKCHKVVII